MYLPKKPRAKKTTITRSRTGCYTCRARRKKCDEEKPICRNCRHSGVYCKTYGGPQLSFLDTTDAVVKRAKAIEARRWAEIRDEKEREKSRNVASRSACTPSKASDWISAEATESPDLLMSSSLDIGFIEDSWLASEPSSLTTSATLVQIPRPPRQYTDDCTRQEHRYMSYFHSWLCSMSFPPSLAQAARSISTNPGLRNSLIALAASDLVSRGFRLDSSEHGGQLQKAIASPVDRSQYVQALSYYDKAIRALAEACAAHGDINQSDCLVAILFCAVFELTRGSPLGYFLHMQGANSLVLRHHWVISRRPHGRSILSAWSRLRASQDQYWLPHRPLEEERLPSPSHTSYALALAYCSTASDELRIILARVVAVRRRIVVQAVMPHQDASAEWYRRNFGEPSASSPQPTDRAFFLDNDCLFALLRQERDNLATWHNKLDSNERPVGDSEDLVSSLALPGPGRQPVSFFSSQSAYQYICYALALLLCDEDGLNRGLAGSCCGSESQVRADTPRRLALLVLSILWGLYIHSCQATIFDLPLDTIISCLVEAYPRKWLTEHLLHSLLPHLEEKAESGFMRLNLARARQVLQLYDQELTKRTPLLVIPCTRIDQDLATQLWYAQKGWQAAVHGMSPDGPFSHFR